MSYVVQDPIAIAVAVVKKRFPRLNVSVGFSPTPGGDERASSHTRYPSDKEAKSRKPTVITLSSTRLPIDSLANALIEALVFAATDPGGELKQTEAMIAKVMREYRAELKRSAKGLRKSR